jgi:hypothetical protein
MKRRKLIYMSTLDECYASGVLVKMGGNLRAKQIAMRLLLCSTAVRDKMTQELPGMKSDDVIPNSARPLAQAADLMNRFVSGGDFLPPKPHEMSPVGNGVWRLRTADLRFDGWFPETNFFVIGAFDSKANCVANRTRDDEMYEEVIDLRRSTNLLGGKFEQAGDYRDLIRL